jgi:hypothetical protein
MAGMLDGEGSLRSANVAVYQRPGAVADRVGEYLLDRGYEFTTFLRARTHDHHSEAMQFVVRKRAQMLRLVGTTRPARWTNDPSWWEGRELPAKDGAWPSIVSIERLDEQPMVDLQTDHQTFVAEGLVSHNSTWVQAKFMQRVTMMEAQYAIAAAQDRKTAGVLFDMAKLIWERLPTDPMLADLVFGEGTVQGAPFSVRPQWVGGGETRNGSQWMVLGDRMRRSDASIYETITAGSGSGGRGYTPSLIHCSEVAHWEDPEFKIGLMEALPTLPETIAIFESTANGFNDFHAMWQNAVSGQEDPELGGYYVPLFFGWQDNPANRREFVSDAARERFERTLGDPDGGGDEEEVELAEAFGLSLEQLFWRRTKLGEPQINHDVDKFHQEHPLTPEQAFIGSGRPVFPGILVARAIKAAQDAPAPVEGVLRGVDWRERKTRSGTVSVPQRALWLPSGMAEPVDVDRWGTSRLRVWGHPLNEDTQSGLPVERRKPDGQYVVFMDVATGEGATFEDGDFHAIQVFDHVTRRQVASYRSRLPLHEMPLLIYLVGLYYNEAWIAVEVNGPGIAIVDALAKDYRYRMLYRRHRAGDDERADARERLIGWMTTSPSKNLMEQVFGAALKEGWHGLRCVLTAREATTYVQDPKRPTHHGAQKGSHDDLLIAAMGAHRVMAELRPRVAKGKRPAWQPADDVTGW